MLTLTIPWWDDLRDERAAARAARAAQAALAARDRYRRHLTTDHIEAVNGMLATIRAAFVDTTELSATDYAHLKAQALALATLCGVLGDTVAYEGEAR
jgi:hypothetical protein